MTWGIYKAVTERARCSFLSSPYLSHIEWNEPSPPNSEEVESYIDEKLDKVFDAK